MNDWYTELIKPEWAPPAWLFGPVWTFLYFLIFISFGHAFVMWWRKKIKFPGILPFILNLFFNLIFTYLQFRLRNNLLAMIDILLVLGTLIYLMISIFPHQKWITYANIPYLLWVSFASILQITITYLNW